MKTFKPKTPQVKVARMPTEQDQTAEKMRQRYRFGRMNNTGRRDTIMSEPLSGRVGSSGRALGAGTSA